MLFFLIHFNFSIFSTCFTVFNIYWISPPLPYFLLEVPLHILLSLSFFIYGFREIGIRVSIPSGFFQSTRTTQLLFKVQIICKVWSEKNWIHDGLSGFDPRTSQSDCSCSSNKRVRPLDQSDPLIPVKCLQLLKMALHFLCIFMCTLHQRAFINDAPYLVPVLL